MGARRGTAGEAADPLTLLTIEEAAAVLGVDKAEVRLLVNEGHLVVYRVGTSAQPRIPRKAIEAWIDGLIARHSARQSGRRRTASDSAAQRPAELRKGAA